MKVPPVGAEVARAAASEAARCPVDHAALAAAGKLNRWAPVADVYGGRPVAEGMPGLGATDAAVEIAPELAQAWDQHLTRADRGYGPATLREDRDAMGTVFAGPTAELIARMRAELLDPSRPIADIPRAGQERLVAYDGVPEPEISSGRNGIQPDGLIVDAPGGYETGLVADDLSILVPESEAYPEIGIAAARAGAAMQALLGKDLWAALQRLTPRVREVIDGLTLQQDVGGTMSEGMGTPAEVVALLGYHPVPDATGKAMMTAEQVVEMILENPHLFDQAAKLATAIIAPMARHGKIPLRTLERDPVTGRGNLAAEFRQVEENIIQHRIEEGDEMAGKRPGCPLGVRNLPAVGADGVTYLNPETYIRSFGVPFLELTLRYLREADQLPYFGSAK